MHPIFIYSCTISRAERLNWSLLCPSGCLVVEIYKFFSIFKKFQNQIIFVSGHSEQLGFVNSPLLPPSSLHFHIVSHHLKIFNSSYLYRFISPSFQAVPPPLKLTPSILSPSSLHLHIVSSHHLYLNLHILITLSLHLHIVSSHHLYLNLHILISLSLHLPIVSSHHLYLTLHIKRSAGVAPEVNLGNPLCTGEEACKRGIHPGFETQSRHQQKSKTGVSVAPQKGHVSSKNFFKKDLHILIYLFISILFLLITYV